MKSYILVFMQFFIIFLMMLPFGRPTETLLVGLVIVLLGGFVGFLAITQHSSGNFNIRPDIKEECSLVTTGIYAYIRHPMYSSVLLMMSGVVVIYPFQYEFVLYALLWGTLLTKLYYEESLWRCHSQEYHDYILKTKRLIPYLF